MALKGVPSKNKKPDGEKFKIFTATMRPDLYARLETIADEERISKSAIISKAFESWLSGNVTTNSTIAGEVVSPPSPVDIERMKAEILSEVMKELSTVKKEEPVQTTITTNSDNSINTEAPRSPDNTITHTNIPPETQDLTETYEAGLVRRFREWMHQHNLNDKTFRASYGIDVSSLKRWGTGERSFPKGRKQELEDVISGIRKPKTDITDMNTT
jgi:hypothetical protein